MIDRRTLKRRGPWPQEFSAQYQTLTDCARVLGGFATVAWQHGLGKHRNIELLQTLLPMIGNEAQEILNTCLWVLQHLEGRWPYWINESIGEIVALAGDVVEAAKRGERGIERGKWRDVAAAVRFCMISGPKIETWLLQGPGPEDGDIQTEVDEIVERAYHNGEGKQWDGKQEV